MQRLIGVVIVSILVGAYRRVAKRSGVCPGVSARRSRYGRMRSEKLRRRVFSSVRQQGHNNKHDHERSPVSRLVELVDAHVERSSHPEPLFGKL
jgi:hypothetical protein